MRLDPSEVGLVKQTFAMVCCVVTNASKLFYERLFELAPELRSQFPGDLRSHGFKFMATLKFLVDGLENPAFTSSTSTSLGSPQALLGVDEEYYQVYGEALLWMLQRTLGRSFTSEVRSAWVDAYAVWTGQTNEPVR